MTFVLHLSFVADCNTSADMDTHIAGPPRVSSMGAIALTRNMSRKNAPPPLVLLDSKTNNVNAVEGTGSGSSTELAVPSPHTSGSSGSTSLPYLKDTSPVEPAGREQVEYEEELDVVYDHDDDNDDGREYPRMRTPAEDKRGGGVYDDLDLGLDPSIEVRVYPSRVGKH